MGYTKMFALWLAEAIYKRKMTDKQIVSAVTGHKHVEMGGLADQIQAVRSNPDLYKRYANQPGNVYEFFDDMRTELKSVQAIGDAEDDYLP